jgi:hypothetical protein
MMGLVGNEGRPVVGLETKGDSSELGCFVEARVPMGSAGNGDACERGWKVKLPGTLG